MGFFSSRKKYRSPGNSANLARAQSNQQRRESILNVNRKLVEYKDKKEPHYQRIREFQGQMVRAKAQYDSIRQRIESAIEQEKAHVHSIDMHMNQLRQRRLTYQKNLKRRSRYA